MATRHARIVDRVATRLKLRQLRLLVAVEKHGSIQYAARELNVSQPSATKMIKDLELDFEVQLRRGADPQRQADTCPDQQCRAGTGRSERGQQRASDCRNASGRIVASSATRDREGSKRKAQAGHQSGRGHERGADARAEVR